MAAIEDIKRNPAIKTIGSIRAHFKKRWNKEKETQHWKQNNNGDIVVHFVVYKSSWVFSHYKSKTFLVSDQNKPIVKRLLF